MAMTFKLRGSESECTGGDAAMAVGRSLESPVPHS